MTTTIDNEHKKLNVPNLRFKEFEGEWEKYKLSELCIFFSGGTPSSSNKEYYGGDIAFIRSGELHANYTELLITQEGFNSSSAKMVDVGDLLLAMYGATSGDIAISKIKGAINQAILCIRTKQSKKFIESVWNKHVSKILRKYLQGGQGNLSADIVKSISFSFPTLAEQEKLANLMERIDTRIATQSKAIDKLQSLIKAIDKLQSLIKAIDKLQSLIRGIMIELRKEGLAHGTWEMVDLRNILSERNELNQSYFPVFSVSVNQGIVNQVELLGRSFAAKDTSKYHVVHHGDLVYTKSPTGAFPYGIVKQNVTQKCVAVSPLYGVYQPQSFSIGMFLHEYFTSEVNTYNYLHPLIQKGAKNTINITNQRFLENCVAMPTDYSTLLLISKLLQRLNNKKQLLQDMLTQYQQQKQHLLRQMFI